MYGTAKGWADALRVKEDGSPAEHGLLASENDEGLFPVRNRIRLPLANPPPPAFHHNFVKQHESANVDRFFGNFWIYMKSSSSFVQVPFFCYSDWKPTWK